MTDTATKTDMAAVHDELAEVYERHGLGAKAAAHRTLAELHRSFREALEMAQGGEHHG